MTVDSLSPQWLDLRMRELLGLLVEGHVVFSSMSVITSCGNGRARKGQRARLHSLSTRLGFEAGRVGYLPRDDLL